MVSRLRSVGLGLGRLGLGLYAGLCVTQVRCWAFGRKYLPVRAQVCCADPYVKVWLIQNGRRVVKKKTLVLKRTLSPQFNETLPFLVAVEQLRHTSLSVHVMDFDRIGRNEEIGRVLLGSRSGPNERRHWNEMLARARLPVTKWHVLRRCDWLVGPDADWSARRVGAVLRGTTSSRRSDPTWNFWWL